ncbi:hypothetical protein AB0F52_09370 [Amycolatopsis sp. NPDC024027]|uniref:hypothetical protein n=1 Tax=Amycolatopsis sp. NPDC024027 TaxID=3154327 RepID=UPI0033E98ABD
MPGEPAARPARRPGRGAGAGAPRPHAAASTFTLVERPEVLYNATTRTYVMYLHIDNTSYSDQRVGVPDR